MLLRGDPIHYLGIGFHSTAVLGPTFASGRFVLLLGLLGLVELGVLPLGLDFFTDAPIVAADADNFTFARFLGSFFSLRGHGIILID
jgi:hypothetical protein